MTPGLDATAALAAALAEVFPVTKDDGTLKPPEESAGWAKAIIAALAAQAHRVAWELTNGLVPDGLMVLHHCDNRRCVRPSHLYLGTHDDNMRDMAERTPEWAYHGLVFVTPKGNPIHGPNLVKPLRAYLAALGLPPITWHDLRHSAASVMLTAGVPLRVIADILGHSTIRVTADLYAHVGPELQREAAEKMEEALR